ncbi:MAG TPA: cellulase family glycosylhydrolase [Chloroflexia bacterium]|nr:cellulase family glycosylhydrolase [Chloroflexia bacterium]
MLHRRLLICCLTLLLGGPPLPMTPAGPPVAAAGGAAPFASPLFNQVWTRTDDPVARGIVGRSWLWGPAPGAVRTEPFQGAPGGSRVVQYFDKARMEVNPAVADPQSPWAVTTGLLVVELVSGRVQTGPDSWESRAPAEVPVAGDGESGGRGAAPVYRSFQGVASLPGGPDRRVAAAPGAAVVATIDRAGTVGALASSPVHYSRYAPETGHNIPDVFDRFMHTRDLVAENGALHPDQLFDPVYLLGYPISEAYWATVPVAGQPLPVLIQLYQRRVLTYIPSFSPAWQVQMGNTGQHYFAWRYDSPPVAAPPTPPPSAPAPAANPPAPPLTDGFVSIAGGQFVYGGQPVVLKGTNYWLHNDPFVGTWTHWDGPEAWQDLAKAHDLGVNTIRIGLPYDNQAAAAVVWGEGCDAKVSQGKGCDHVDGWITNQMTQLLQVASGYGMKVIFALFDWSDSFPAPGSPEYQRQMNYLQGIVAPFAGDDRVLAWDLHNEPDNYPTWTDAHNPGQVVDWAGHLAGAVRALDRHHPITIGIGTAANLWLAPHGQRLIDLVDFVSFHCYDAGALQAQMAAIAAHTSKPILLEEMGWPTGPAAESQPGAEYSEAVQQYLYQSMLATARAGGLAGVVQWTLWDFPPGITNGYHYASHEEWFGLVRLDGSFKPAAADFRDGYPAPLLPSRTVSDVPLTPAQHHSAP